MRCRVAQVLFIPLHEVKRASCEEYIGYMGCPMRVMHRWWGGVNLRWMEHLFFYWSLHGALAGWQYTVFSDGTMVTYEIYQSLELSLHE